MARRVSCKSAGVTDDARPARYGDVFGIAEFRALFASYVISMLGDVIAAVALTVLVYERTGSPVLAAATFSIAFVPYLLGGALLFGTRAVEPRFDCVPRVWR